MTIKKYQESVKTFYLFLSVCDFDGIRKNHGIFVLFSNLYKSNCFGPTEMYVKFETKDCQSWENNSVYD